MTVSNLVQRLRVRRQFLANVVIITFGLLVAACAPMLLEDPSAQADVAQQASSTADWPDVVTIEEDSPQRQFFDEHLEYIFAGDIEGMIRETYTEDAVLISPFDIYEETSPPHIVRGHDELIQFFNDYMAWQGAINVESIDQFAGTNESIFFQATFTSNTGRWVVGDAWHLEDGKIAVHYSFDHLVNTAEEVAAE